MRNKHVNILSQVNINLLVSVINVLILIATVILGLLFADIPIARFAAILVTIWFATFTAAGLGYLLLRKLFSDLLKKEDYLLDELNDAYASKNTAISNNVLKYFEESADKIRIVSPDLVDDSAEFYETVLSNVKQNKKYQYIIPNKIETISKMRQIIKRLLADTEKERESELSIEYRVWNDSPIILEVFLYEDLGRGRLKGFVEVCINSENSNAANIPLTNNEAHKLNAWFDELFEPQSMHNK